MPFGSENKRLVVLTSVHHIKSCLAEILIMASLSVLQEFFSDRNDTSLFMFGSHNKKRPHNLVIGRLFDHHVLDMVELGINSFKAIHDFTTSKCVLGSKPCFVFSGDAFETDQDYIRLKNLFIGINTKILLVQCS